MSSIHAADPDIITHTVTDQTEFLVLACDGMLGGLQVPEVLCMKAIKRNHTFRLW